MGGPGTGRGSRGISLEVNFGDKSFHGIWKESWDAIGNWKQSPLSQIKRGQEKEAPTSISRIKSEEKTRSKFIIREKQAESCSRSS